jgi:hypothetical protein
MQKLVAFLEKYAEWLGVGVASLFFLFVVYSYVVSPEQVKVKVGSDAVFPGSVDEKVNESSVKRLQTAMEAPSNLTFPVPDFAGDFQKKMGDKRERMTSEVLAGGPPIRPAIPGFESRPEPTGPDRVVIKDLPQIAAPVMGPSNNGSSMVAPLPALAEAGADPTQPPPPPPPPVDDATLLASAIDKNWITVSAKFDMKALIAEWKRVFFANGKPLPLPPQVFITNFLQVEVEREEQTGPDQWGNKVTLKPLPLITIPDYPNNKDPQAEEIYRAWAETHQVDIVEPSFFRVLKGDFWTVPGAPKDATAVVDTTTEPFDPANPNIPFEKMTSAQKQQVYIYNQAKKAEEQKAKAAERKSKTDAAEAARKSASGTGSGGGGGGGGGGGRRIGGYAPLPIQLAANPGDPSDPRSRERAGGGRTVPPGAMRPNPATPIPSRAIPPDGSGGNRRDIPRREAYPSDGYRRMPVPIPTTPQLNPDGQIQTQNAALTGPFDPTRLPLDIKGAPPEILMWAHDDTAQAGKTYRYRMRVKMKNPLYHVFGVAANEADTAKLALESPFSDWKEVTAPRTTEFFFAQVRQSLISKTVSSVTVDVFRHEKGQWMKETFTVSPGDGIGGVKSVDNPAGGKTNVDFSTGMTLVDLRPDTRDKDLRILVSDDVGNLTTINYQAQLNDQWYKELQNKINKPDTLTPGSAPAAAAGNPAFINEVGGR